MTRRWIFTVFAVVTALVLVAAATAPAAASNDDETVPAPEFPGQDLDGDGLYEDVNGDGNVSISDVVVLFENLHSDVIQDDPEKVDFNSDSSAGVGDVVVLFNEYIA